MSTYYVPDIVLGTGDMEVNKREREIPCPHEASNLVWKADNFKNIQYGGSVG